MLLKLYDLSVAT